MYPTGDSASSVCVGQNTTSFGSILGNLKQFARPGMSTDNKTQTVYNTK